MKAIVVFSTLLVFCLKASAESMIIQPGREFAPDSYVYKNLPNNAPIYPKSPTYVANVQKQIKAHYGHADVNIDGGTPPIYIVPIDQPTVRVKYVDWENPAATFSPCSRNGWLCRFQMDFSLRPGSGDYRR
jgi:hypothetical protein